MVSLGGKDGSTSSYLVVARGRWLSTEDNQGGKVLLWLSPTRWWVIGDT